MNDYKQTPGNSSQTAAPSAAPTTAAPSTTTASVACVNCTTDAGDVVTSEVQGQCACTVQARRASSPSATAGWSTPAAPRTTTPRPGAPPRSTQTGP